MPSSFRSNPTFVRGNYKPCGFAQYVGPAASTALTTAPATGVALPTVASATIPIPIIAAIQVDAQSIRYTDDGVTVPTATVGILIPTNSLFIYDGDLNAFRMIQTAVSATVNISYYA